MYWPKGVRAIKCKCSRVIADRERVVEKVKPFSGYTMCGKFREWDV